MTRLAMATFAAALAAAWAPAAGATDIYAKPGATAAEQARLTAACQEAASRVSVDRASPTSVYNANGYAFMASAFAAGVINGYRTAGAQARFRDQCMRKDGWARITLSAQEAAAYDKTSGDARAAWVEALLKTEVRTRVEAALAPKAPKLPTAGFELAVGAVRFDPAALVPAQGPVGRGQALLTGKVEHRRTATLREELAVPSGLGSTRLPKGAVYQQVDFRPPDVALDDPASSYWCGKPAGGSRTACLWSEEDGYHYALPDERSKTYKRPALNDWLVASPEFSGPETSKASKVIKGPVLLDVSETDLVGPMDFALRIETVEDYGLQLAAVARRDGADIVFWDCFVRFDESGQGVVPLWSHRLTLTRQGAAVTVAYTPDGDGHGLGDMAAFKSPQGF